MKRIMLIASILATVIFCSCQPAPAPQAPPPAPVVQPVKPVPSVVPVRRDLHRCIFSEGLKGCRYNDVAMAKVGRNGVKPYSTTDILTDDFIGY